MFSAAHRRTPTVARACHCVPPKSVPSLHSQIHGAPTSATTSSRLTDPPARTTPHTSTRARTRAFSRGATKSNGFSCRARFPPPGAQKRCPTTHQVTPFPTSTMQNARCRREPPRPSCEATRAVPPMAALPHHAKRTLNNRLLSNRILTNVKIYDRPLRGSIAQPLHKPRRASKAPHLPRDMHVRRPLGTRITHHYPRLPREAPSLDPAPRTRCQDSRRLPPRTRRHARNMLNCSAQADMPRTPADARGRSRTPANVRRPAHRARKRVKHDPAPRPPLRNKNPSLRIREKHTSSFIYIIKGKSEMSVRAPSQHRRSVQVPCPGVPARWRRLRPESHTLKAIRGAVRRSVILARQWRQLNLNSETWSLRELS